MSLRTLFTLSDLPVLQNKTYQTCDEAIVSPVANLVLAQDFKTGLVFNSAFDASKLRYDPEYQNEQAHSKIFQEHLDNVSQIIHRNFFEKTILEVGCGKGYFLGKMKAEGYNIIGIDPAYEGDSPLIVKSLFEKGLGLAVDCLILRHTLEHIAEPLSFLSSILHANSGKGALYIEVPCFDWILEKRAWFDVFYEHVNYFRLGDFYRMFGEVYEAGRIFGGQYLYAVVNLATLRAPKAAQDTLIDFPADFISGLDAMIRRNRSGKKRVVWGASSKGVLFALHMLRANAVFDFAVDLNPLKQNRYLPVTGMKVNSPQLASELLADNDEVFVMNSNYYDEIKLLSNNRFNYIKIDQ